MITADQLLKQGFSDDIVETKRRLIASLAGLEKVGKTHFSLTAPEPIIFFNVDIGTEGVVGKFQSGEVTGKKKRILVYDVKVPAGAAKEAYAILWKDLKAKIEMAYQLNMGTVVMDTATETHELSRLAHFGKLTQVMPHHYVQVNSEWRDLIRNAYVSDMNTIMIHKLKPKWVDNVRTKEYEVAGFNETRYLVQANLVAKRTVEKGEKMPKFSVLIEDCRQNPKVTGTNLNPPMCNFDFLLSLIHGKGK